MKPRVSILTLGVADLTRSVAFYRDGLGLPLRDGAEGIAFFDLQGLTLALYPREALAEDATVPAEGAGFRSFTLAHNVGSPDEVDRTLAEAVEGGATLVKAGQQV
ncbi:MAG: VOC family protein, partial [Deltaproteobacteria bacterium]|nr:VOC family protein [Deltaproteobacteria bacterium]